jgi:hypothetical protein
VQEHGPALERVLERLAQLVDVAHDPEPALGVRVLERVLVRRPGLRDPGRCPDREVEQGLGCLLGQMFGKLEQPVLVDLPYGIDPIRRHAIGQKYVVGMAREQRRLGDRHIFLRRDIARHDVLDPLADLDQLGGPGRRVPLDPPPLGPGIGIVVMVDVAQQKASLGLVHD